MREETPNDPKLSDGGGWRGPCMAGGKVAAEARAVTAVAVRCSAWLGVSGRIRVALNDSWLVVMTARLAVAVVNGLIAIRAHTRLLGAFVFARHRILALLAVDFTLADVDALLAVVTDAVSRVVVVYWGAHSKRYSSFWPVNDAAMAW